MRLISRKTAHHRSTTTEERKDAQLTLVCCDIYFLPDPSTAVERNDMAAETSRAHRFPTACTRRHVTSQDVHSDS